MRRRHGGGGPDPAPGVLRVVGLGPGSAEHMTPAALAALAGSAAVVGYTGYLALLDPALLAGRQVVGTGMTGEVERCGRAVDLALSGLDTAVVCSGDPGIYAMAGLVLEILEARGLADSVPFEVVPGVPAFAAAAALLGAPLMHDFASVSLSDLLTPWDTIEKRLDAAAGADFVIALYNPRSRRRADHLERALAVVLRHRDAQTPVGVVTKAMRDGEAITVTRLGAVDVGGVDMQSIVIIGNSSTREVGGRILTPRGYREKYDLL